MFENDLDFGNRNIGLFEEWVFCFCFFKAAAHCDYCVKLLLKECMCCVALGKLTGGCSPT